MRYEAIDIETTSVGGVVKPIALAITSNARVNYLSIQKEEVDSPRLLYFLLDTCSHRKIYYAHNLTFEMFAFLPFLVKEQIRFSLVSSNYTIYSATIYFKSKVLRFRCSYQLTLMPLEQLADLLGIGAKLTFPHLAIGDSGVVSAEPHMFKDYSAYLQFVRRRGRMFKVDEALQEYCKNDAWLTKLAINKFWGIVQLPTKPKFILTAAKLAVSMFFSKKTLVKANIDRRLDQCLRPYYFGGRVEVFGNLLAGERALHFDWSGMYARCMEEKVLGGEVIKSNLVSSLEHPGFYWIVFEQNADIPVLPIKRGKLLFANGVFEGWYWFEEILLAIEHGTRVLEVKKVITAQYYDYFLRPFASKNRMLRERGGVYKVLGKNSNNTFYGRLGMDPDRDSEYVGSGPIKGAYKVAYVNGVAVSAKKGINRTSNITVAAAVTAKARVRLYKGVLAVQGAGGRILYTDTDSIVAAFKDSDYEAALNRPLGEVFFDAEDPLTVVEDAVFAMPKTYALVLRNGQVITKVKGIAAKPSFYDFKTAFYAGKALASTNTEWSKHNFNLEVKEVTKTINLMGLDKRKWRPCLKFTSPLSLDQVPPLPLPT